MNFILKHPWIYYLLQWTWGLPMNLVGGSVFLFLKLFKHKTFKHSGPALYTTVGKTNWGGVSLGMFILVSPRPYTSTILHESGHTLQNILWGFLFPFVIGLPSFIRFHYRNWRLNRGHTLKTTYDSIWFEHQASVWGEKYFFRFVKEDFLNGQSQF